MLKTLVKLFLAFGILLCFIGCGGARVVDPADDELPSAVQSEGDNGAHAGAGENISARVHTLNCHAKNSIIDKETTGRHRASITWTAPIQRENGDVLHLFELSGYTITIGRKDKVWVTTQFIPEEGFSGGGCTVTILPNKDYFLEIGSVGRDGLHSDLYAATFRKDVPSHSEG